MPEANVRLADGDVLGWEAFPTQGHASHHVSYLRDGTLLAGDAAGVRMPGASYVLPVSPPPDVDVEAWHATTDAIRSRSPERLALIHFGVHEDVATHLDRLDAELDRWAARVRDGMDQDAFVEAALADAGADAEAYDRVAPFWQSWQGMKRYWDTDGVTDHVSVSAARPAPPPRVPPALRRPHDLDGGQRDGAGRARVRRPRPDGLDDRPRDRARRRGRSP